MIRDLYLVEFTVADWPAAVAWYRDTLRLALLVCDDANQFALFRAGGGRLALKAGIPHPGTVLISFEVADLEQALACLAARGVAAESPPKTSVEGYRRATIRDLNGYRLCLFEWTAELPSRERRDQPSS